MRAEILLTFLGTFLNLVKLSRSISTEDGWYAAISNSKVQVNLKIHKLNEDFKGKYYTGVSIQHFDKAGNTIDTFLVEAKDMKSNQIMCSNLGKDAPSYCLGGGGADFFHNDEKILEPENYKSSDGNFNFAAANVNSHCQNMANDRIVYTPRIMEGRKMVENRGKINFLKYLVSRPISTSNDCKMWLKMALNAFDYLYKVPGTKSTILHSTPSLLSVIEYDTQIAYLESGEEMTSIKIGYHADLFTSVKERKPSGFLGEAAKLAIDLVGSHYADEEQAVETDYSKYRVENAYGRVFEAKFH